MGNKILLIRPQNIYNYNNYPPLNLISIATKLKSAGYEVKIFNSAFEKDIYESLNRELQSLLFVGISFLTSEIRDAYQIMKYVKENSKVPIVTGGWHPTLFPFQTADSKYVDYVVAGEGEEHIVKIAELIKGGETSKNRIFNKQVLNLETLPLPDYSLDDNIDRFINNYLTDKLSEYVSQPMRWLPYESSRGCPSQCTFCINVVSDNTKYRKKSAEKVISEIEYIVKKYNLTHLKIIDDNFFVDIERVRKICQGIIQKGINITWDGECRCDYFNERMLNDETLMLIKKSGLVQLTLGIESGSAHTLKLMKKGITTDEAEYAVKKCDQYGIIARSSFILEIPGETLNDIKRTIKFITRLRKYKFFTCGVGTFRPYPKCELTQKLLRGGYLTEPSNLEDWVDNKVINMYTSAEYVRPWQVNGKYSESAAYYLNMESAVRLGNHQIDRVIDKIINKFFIFFAKLRNKIMFYKFPIDKVFYKKFLMSFYERKKNLEKCGSYPLGQLKESGKKT